MIVGNQYYLLSRTLSQIVDLQIFKMLFGRVVSLFVLRSSMFGETENGWVMGGSRRVICYYVVSGCTTTDRRMNRIESNPFFLNWSLDEFMIIFVEFVDFDSRKPQTHGETVIACNAQ
jgi:hypothetical protein